MSVIDTLVEEWKQYPDKSMRLGQYFMNFYLTGYNWPSLYYEQDYHTALNHIKEWLSDHQYYDELPQKKS